ncbi:MAG: hypothetical protein AAF628_33710 [Planctomycetota bacterium]
MANVSSPNIQSAARRLAGHLVATPVIGALRLPGFPAPIGLRLKADLLQPSGSTWFRGAMHALLRQMGAVRGVVSLGTPRQMLGVAAAAELHRLPLFAAPVVEGGVLDAAWAGAFAAYGCIVAPQPSWEAARAAVEARRATAGDHVLRLADDEDVRTGLATVGLELARELPSETEVVLVAPAELAEPLSLGLAAGGAPIPVQGLAAASAVPAAFGAAVRAGLRLDVGPAALAALHAALQRGPSAERVCVVLAE